MNFLPGFINENFPSEEKEKFNTELEKRVMERTDSLSKDNQNLRIKMNLDGTFLENGTAILCSLIINELVSNSLKYAFPGNREGEISIEMDFYDNKYILIVRDNGVGLPSTFDFRNTNSLGLQIVNMFTAQINGEIELINRDHTEFRITFPRKSNSELPQSVEYERIFTLL